MIDEAIFGIAIVVMFLLGIYFAGKEYEDD